MFKFVLSALALALLAPALFAADAPAPDTSKWVGFSNFNYTGKAVVTPKEGEFANPVVAGFYPDPSFCRVGDDYYLVNSSFNYFPGIPVWHSKDLVNWTQIGNVLDRPSQFSSMRGGAMQNGVYAPTIRYHNGTYYVINTLVGGANNFYCTATDPKGPWSEPNRIQVGGIDPDLFFDDDGKCYVANCDDPPGGSKYNGHRAICLQELDLTQKKMVGEKFTLVNGGTDITKEPHWCEGPHLYKINGKYFLMCAQGGTSENHTEVIFRSDSLKGPYTPWDKNPILTQMDLTGERTNPITSTGHADLLQTQNGEWWSVFLGCQPYEAGFYNTGRQTFMLPVTWTDGWPVILPPKTPVPLTVKKPNLPAGAAAPVATTGNVVINDNFDADKLHFRWVGIRGPQSTWYSLDKSKKTLFLEPRAVKLNANGNPTYLGIRQQNNDYSCTVTVSAQPTTANSVAGIAAFMDDNHWYAINVKIADGKLAEVAVEQATPAARGNRGGAPGGARRGGPTTMPGDFPPIRRGGPTGMLSSVSPILAADVPAPTANPLPANTTTITLKIQGAGAVTQCFYKVGNAEFKQVGADLQSSFLSTSTAGGFQGATLGMFAHD